MYCLGVNRNASHPTFCVTRSTSQNYGKILFTDIILDDSGSFNLSTSEFTPPLTGLYCLHWSISLKNKNYIDISLNGGPHTPDIIKYGSQSIDDITSRDELVTLASKQKKLFLSSDYDTIHSDSGPTSFSGFHLDSTMNPAIAFSFGRSTVTSNYGTIPFDIVVVDTHNSWNYGQHTYTIPQDGTYVITLMTATNKDIMSRSRIRLYNDLKFITGINCANQCKYTSREITLSKTVIIACKKRSKLYASLENNEPIYSDFRYHTALMGFLYTPQDGTPVAWSVARSISFKCYNDACIINYNHVFVNDGNGWLADNNTFIAPMPGVYYVHMATSITRGSDVLPQLLVNGIPNLTSARGSTSLPLSRAVILRLQEGGQLQVCIYCPSIGNGNFANDCGMYSNKYRLGTFSGYRIHT